MNKKYNLFKKEKKIYIKKKFNPFLLLSTQIETTIIITIIIIVIVIITEKNSYR